VASEGTAEEEGRVGVVAEGAASGVGAEGAAWGVGAEGAASGVVAEGAASGEGGVGSDGAGAVVGAGPDLVVARGFALAAPFSSARTVAKATATAHDERTRFPRSRESGTGAERSMGTDLNSATRV